MLNHNLPQIDGLPLFVWAKHITKNTQGFLPCKWVCVKTIKGKALAFEILIEGEWAAMYDKLPINLLAWEEVSAPMLSLSQLQYWDCPSYHASIIVKHLIAGTDILVYIKNGQPMLGRYLFTIDFCHPDTEIIDTNFSEYTPEHKSMNVIALENGQICAYPNNAIRILDSSLTDKLENIKEFKQVYGLMSQPEIPSVECPEFNHFKNNHFYGKDHKELNIK